MHIGYRIETETGSNTEQTEYPLFNVKFSFQYKDVPTHQLYPLMDRAAAEITGISNRPKRPLYSLLSSIITKCLFEGAVRLMDLPLMQTLRQQHTRLALGLVRESGVNFDNYY